MTDKDLAAAIGEVVDQRMTEMKMSNAKLARLLDLPRQTIGSWRKGTNVPRPENARALAEALKLPLSAVSADPRHINVALPEPDSQNSRRGRIPVIDWIDAGQGAAVVSAKTLNESTIYIEPYFNVSELAFALTVKGDSMLPEFADGSIIVIDPMVEPKAGDFIVAELLQRGAEPGSGDATFKQYMPRGSVDGAPCFDLVPLNPEYDTVTVSSRNPGRIIGTMVQHIRPFAGR